MKKIFIFFSLLILFFPAHLQASNNEGKDILKIIQDILSFGTRVVDTKQHYQVESFLSKNLSKTNASVKEYSFTAKTPFGEKNMVNIVATIKPEKTIKKTLVFAAHYDSKYFKDFPFYGADDSASGVGVLVFLAQRLKSLPLQNTQIKLLFLDGEEAFVKWSDTDSLYGSKYQAKYWSKHHQLEDIQSFILLDMVGGKNPRFCYEASSNPHLSEAVFNLAQMLKVSNFNKDCFFKVEDDHLPFKDYGVKVLDIIPYPFPAYWHNVGDTFDKLSPDTLEKVYKVILAYIIREDQKKGD